MTGSGDPGTASPGGKAGRYRFLVLAVIFSVFLASGLDRAAVSLLLVDPGFLRDMDLEGSPERQGLVMTMLLLPYALSNIFLGPSADRWGPRRVVTAMAGGWAVAAMWLGAATSYPLLLAGRVARGVAEGPLFPSANRFVRYWFPPRERGAANAIWASGQRLGLAIAVPLLAAVIVSAGWRFAFFLQALLIAVIVVPAVWFVTADRPEATSRVGSEERAHIGLERPGEKERLAGGGSNLGRLLRNYRYWLMVTYHFAVLAVYSGLTTWLPKYLREARGFDVAQMVLFASLPYLLASGSSLVFGYISDRVGWRATLCALSLAGASGAVGLAAIATDPVLSALLVVLGVGIWGIGTPIYYAIMQRIVPAPIMATGIGIDNGVANLGAAMAPTAIGFMIGATGSYLPGLLFLSAVGLVGSAGAAVLAVQRY